MSHDEAVKQARVMLAQNAVAGVTQAGDTLGQPSEARVEQLATILSERSALENSEQG